MTIRSILASLHGSHGDVGVLETAALAHKVLGAWVDCLHVTHDFSAEETLLAYSLGPERSLPSERIRALEADFAERSLRARKAFDECCTRHHLASPNAGGRFSYLEARGMHPQETVHEARFRDLTIIGREAANDSLSIEKLGTVVMGCGRGVLISPQKAAATFGQNVVIAWKDTPEAAHAVTTAMPILAHAQSIHVVAANDDGAEPPLAVETSINVLAGQLRRHGLTVEAKLLPFNSHTVLSRLLDRAYGVNADLLVMGGYGHGRLREYVFGGVTREVLADCDIPVLMTH